MSEKKIVIVESPKKAKEISHFLGKDFIVKATVGHFKDLPENEMGVDLNTYEPKFVIKSQNHKKILSEIKKLAEKSEVIIATDPDREGYAIGYFMYEELKKKAKEVKRAEFHEITKEHIKEKIKNAIPFEKTNFGLFNAFLGRRVGDRIVGYTLSPIASREIGGRFSVGRVQSPAVRLVVEREIEIQNFKPTPYYVLSAVLSKAVHELLYTFTATYENSKIENKEEAEKIYLDIKDEKTATLKKVEKKQVKQSPKPPFTTSTLQQSASTVYRFPPEKTMMLAQDLFESGLITYHRTDSVRISEKAIDGIRNLINKEFGKDYLPEKIRVYKSKNTQADAHEAIRITHFVNLEGQKKLIQEKGLSEDHFKLLKLIYERTVASQMADAIFERTNVTVDIKGYTFKASGSILKFKGYKAVYDLEEEQEETQNLPDLKNKDVLNIEKIDLEEKFTKPPARYTEGGLVKKLEELGIGRPSTYATIIKTIKERGYVVKENGSLRPTENAFHLIEYLNNRYNWVIDYSFTKKMEDFLDKVEENKKDWKEFVRQLHEKSASKQDVKISKKMLDYAKDLAEKHGKSIEEIKDDPEKLKEFIDAHAEKNPSQKQIEYAKSLAEKTGLKLTDKELSDRKLLTKWIDKAKKEIMKNYQLSEKQKNVLIKYGREDLIDNPAKALKFIKSKLSRYKK
ncbi:type I DNA topoisomerase [Sulfurihydrogenibium yellowstonense]|uniref:DNA topoisomerase 1 n=1 Tax=Sulfurihydrogenibium yellowstonense SS-5 TaxID=432331 RepID=C4FK05_9AQUI|nr:type I DNA topoisomerase [Sulfurihydrogenibium yellowstonense]EEP60599.1 DNA topoisomerase I [Sulfurihydrogenibium yellowstonense SS-5]